MIVANAVYHHGKLEPSEPLELEEGQEVRLQIDTPQPVFQKRVLTSNELKLIERLKKARSLEELHNIINSAPPISEEVDVLQAINETRRQTGFRVPDQE